MSLRLLRLYRLRFVLWLVLYHSLCFEFERYALFLVLGRWGVLVGIREFLVSQCCLVTSTVGDDKSPLELRKPTMIFLRSDVESLAHSHAVSHSSWRLRTPSKQTLAKMSLPNSPTYIVWSRCHAFCIRVRGNIRTLFDDDTRKLRMIALRLI